MSLGSATFDAVTVGSNLVLSASSLNIKNGLTLANGVTFNTGATTLYYQGSQTIGVAGTGGAATLQRTGGVNYVNSRVASRRNVTR